MGNKRMTWIEGASKDDLTHLQMNDDSASEFCPQTNLTAARSVQDEEALEELKCSLSLGSTDLTSHRF